MHYISLTKYISVHAPSGVADEIIAVTMQNTMLSGRQSVKSNNMGDEMDQTS